MRYRILCVGRRARDPLVEAAEEYQKRLSRYVKLDLVRIRDADAKTERDELLSRIKPNEHLVVLDERGKQMTSQKLATRLSDWQSDGRDLCFIIGGPDGVSSVCRERADSIWSLSDLTLPHGLARVLFAEQLYRAWSLHSGHPYHRE